MPSLLPHHQKTRSLLLQAVWFCLIAFKLSIWWFYWCAVLSCLPLGGRGVDDGAGETGEECFSAVLQPRSIKKENPQPKLANVQHKRKLSIIKTTGNTVQHEKGQTWIWHRKQRGLSPANPWLEFRLEIWVSEFIGHLIQWNLLSVPVNLS